MTENRSKSIETRRESGGKPLKSLEIGFGDFAWKVRRKTPSCLVLSACVSSFVPPEQIIPNHGGPYKIMVCFALESACDSDFGRGLKSAHHIEIPERTGSAPLSECNLRYGYRMEQEKINIS